MKTELINDIRIMCYIRTAHTVDVQKMKIDLKLDGELSEQKEKLINQLLISKKYVTFIEKAN